MIPALIGYATIALCLATLAALGIELMRHVHCHIEQKPLPALPNASLKLLRATILLLPVALWVLQ